jgi:hypothetical protein
MSGAIYSDVYIPFEKLFNVTYIYRQKEVIGAYVRSFKSLLFGLAVFLNFLVPYTARRTPWTGDQADGRPLPTHRATQTQNEHRYPCLETCLERNSSA